MYDESEAGAADRGARINLPVLGTVERRWDTYQPFLKVVGVYHPLEDPKMEGYLKEEPPPKSTFGSAVADPSASDGWTTGAGAARRVNPVRGLARSGRCPLPGRRLHGSGWGDRCPRPVRDPPMAACAFVRHSR